MENAIVLSNSSSEERANYFVIDTTFVLFFLAMELGGDINSLNLGTILSILTIGMFVVLPYFLPFAGEKPEFTGWVLGRVFITIVGLIGGLAIHFGAGTVFPESAEFLPMTLLIISGIFCAGLQIRDIIRVRLAS
jgi:hypothetical protein